MKIKLIESTVSPDSIFVDQETGKRYTWNGKSFTEIKNKKQKGSSQSDSSEDRNKEKEKSPQIGDKPNEDDEILKQEEEARQKENEESKAGLNDSQREEEEKKEQQRIAKIKDMLKDPDMEDKIKDETERKVFKSRQTKAERERKRELKRYEDTAGVDEFIFSINNFLRNELKKERFQTYSKLNKTYNINAGSNIIRRGNAIRKNQHIPSINVYYDQSGSWGSQDIEMGNSVLATLKKYVDRGQIKLDIYYFDTKVQDTPNNLGGGTLGEPVMKHIHETNPDNVIILTDSDISDISSPTEVNGGVWFLWKNGLVSNNLKHNLSGRKLTKGFTINPGEIK